MCSSIHQLNTPSVHIYFSVQLVICFSVNQMFIFFLFPALPKLVVVVIVVGGVVIVVVCDQLMLLLSCVVCVGCVRDRSVHYES